MKNAFLYIITVLIWGSTWITIEYQINEIAIEVSLVYRFALAAFIILALSKILKLNLTFSLRQHAYMAALGLLNFCLNYVMLYKAQVFLSSAMTSIGFSMLLLMNIVNTRLFFGKPIAPKTYLGAVIGIIGIVTLFWPEVRHFGDQQNSLNGIFYVLAGTLFASFGNMISVKNSLSGLPVLQTSGFGMLYGTLFLTIFALLNNAQFTFSSQPSYLLSLGYLTIFGTVIAFYSYFMLLKNIGPEKASYSIVLFPMVAVILSTLFENFEWTQYTVSGFVLVASGNLLVLVPAKKLKKAIASAQPITDVCSTTTNSPIAISDLKQPL